MPTINEVIQGILSKGGERQGNGLWIKCPWHRGKSGGQETTASLRISIDGSYQPGSFICFGCSPRRSGNWHTLAVKLGLREGDADDDGPVATTLPGHIVEELISEDQENPDHEMLLREPLFPIKQKWRGISGKLLHELQARVTTLHYSESRVYLPIWQLDRWRSGIYCTWSSKAKIKYQNENGPKTTQLLFPYDVVANKLSSMPSADRKLCLVEGPRDALNLLQHDILALANIGGTSVWTKDKAELVENLDLTAVVLATDPDKVGRELAQMMRDDLRNSVPKIARFKMQPETKDHKKEDPGNLSKDRIEYLRERMKRL